MSVGLLVSLWLVLLLLVNPVGEFALNDDWSYARSVQTLLQHGEFRLTHWTSMPLIAQVLWGALFCVVFGFSFTTLRFSTLVLGLIGVLAVYALLRMAKASPYVALLGALLVALNPLYFQLANTFMSDVPFMVVALLSTLALARGLRRASARVTGVGLVLATVASLIRQTGLMLPAAFGLVYLRTQGVRVRTLLVAAMPLALTAALLAVYRAWLAANDNLPIAYDEQTRALLAGLSRPPGVLAVALFENLVIAIMYLGLFALPLLLVAAWSHWRALLPARKLWSALLSGSAALGVWLMLWAQRRFMPLSDNLLFDFGVGPLTLRDTYVLRLPHYPTAPAWLWPLVTLMSALGAVLLVAQLVLAWRLTRAPHEARPLVLLALSMALVYFAPLVLIHLFDRYLLILLPLLLVPVAAAMRPLPREGVRGVAGLAALLFVLYAVFSVSATHDYLAWNRARWSALDELLAAQVLPTEIDGGFEFNDWHLFPYYYQSPWSLHHDQFVAAFGPLDGYAVKRRYPFQRWLSLDRADIYILERQR